MTDKEIIFASVSRNIEVYSDGTTNKTRDQVHRLEQKNEKYQQTLQEIKNFLEVPEFYLYGKETIHDNILQLITKAESEDCRYNE